MNTKSIDVLTPLAACTLFGRSGEAVRRAAREGHVHTRASLMLTAKQIRLIDLKSALAYWGRPGGVGIPPLEHSLQDMRAYGFTFRPDPHSPELQVLHPYPAVIRHEFNLTPDLDLT